MLTALWIHAVSGTVAASVLSVRGDDGGGGIWRRFLKILHKIT
jgi:hypothetical protein